MEIRRRSLSEALEYVARDVIDHPERYSPVVLHVLLGTFADQARDAENAVLAALDIVNGEGDHHDNVEAVENAARKIRRLPTSMGMGKDGPADLSQREGFGDPDEYAFRVEHGPLHPDTAAMIVAATNRVGVEPEIRAATDDDTPLTRPWRDIRAEMEARRPGCFDVGNFEPPDRPGDIKIESIAPPPGVRATFVPDTTSGYGSTEDEAMRDLYDKMGLPVPCVCGDSVHSAVGTCPLRHDSQFWNCPRLPAAVHEEEPRD